MSDREPMHPGERHCEQRVRELTRVDADGAFRERLRGRFVDGSLRPVGETRGPARSRLPWRWGLTAAAVVGVIVVVLLNRSPSLRVIDASGSGTVVIDNRVLPVTDVNRLRDHMRSRAAVQLSDDARIDLLAEGVALIELTPGTRMSVPPMPRPLFARATACSLTAGEMHIRTGPGFRGAIWRIYTPHGMIEVTGTLLSVQCDDGGTCVCVLEGVARVGVDAADLQPVEPGFRKVMKRDGSTEVLPVKDMHRDGLLDFDRRVGDRIRR